MGRKVFISVLGSTNYGKCKYAYKEEKFISAQVRFIQEATLQMLKADKWDSNSKIYICVTDGANGSLALNWKDNGHHDRTSGDIIQCEGLEKRINLLKLPFDSETLIIKDVKSKDEIWSVFDTVYEKLNDEDEIYFDITHGFRYLPMLILVLSNYAKFLKKVKVKSITYGNYEAKYDDVAPIIDITSLSNLQDWTSASQMFLKTGQTKNIADLVKDHQLDSLKNFANEIFEVRGREIISGKSALETKEILSKIKIKETPFISLKEKLLFIFDNFKENDINNVYYAVKFCNEFGLIQQGYTLFLEFIISKVLLDIGVSENSIFDTNIRNIASSALSLRKADNFNYNIVTINRSMVEDLVQKIFALSYKKQLTKKIYLGLSLGGRNDLNHGGFRPEDQVKTRGYFMKKLGKYLEVYDSIFKN